MAQKQAARFRLWKIEEKAPQDASQGSVPWDAFSGSDRSVGHGVESFAARILDLRGPQFEDVNTLQTNMGAQIDPSGSGVWVTSDDSLILSANYIGLVPQYARGYFGQRTVEAGPDTNQLTLFDALPRHWR